ncbi:hypothetical protein DRH14_04610 [Candidatus Shapirobacteria bacterium]|nr:MAG: hypothetical protein DRH14_04610 [Candidatus Shapirobacteria bacterium]
MPVGKQRAGYILVFKPTLEIKKQGKVTVKGNVDAELVLHTMIELNNFDKAIIVSGDGCEIMVVNCNKKTTKYQLYRVDM